MQSENTQTRPNTISRKNYRPRLVSAGLAAFFLPLCAAGVQSQSLSPRAILATHTTGAPPVTTTGPGANASGPPQGQPPSVPSQPVQAKPRAPRTAAPALTPHQKRLAAHNARLAAHNARLAKQRALHQQHVQARLAKRRKAAEAHAAKVARQHKALTSGNVVQAAYSLRGTRYVFGGTSRSGFDCSGFVRYILSTTGGVDMPRTATEQYYDGTPVPIDQLQPGDLVFFKNTYKHGISHVGIYAGNGKFIHAANAHKGVRMDDLSDAYYRNHFAGARRVLPEQMRRQAALLR